MTLGWGGSRARAWGLLVRRDGGTRSYQHFPEEIHAVAGLVSAQRLDRREDGGHAGLVLDLLEQLLADQKGLDTLLHDLGHSPGDHEGGVLDIQRVLDGVALDGPF